MRELIAIAEIMMSDQCRHYDINRQTKRHQSGLISNQKQDTPAQFDDDCESGE